MSTTTISCLDCGGTAEVANLGAHTRQLCDGCAKKRLKRERLWLEDLQRQAEARADRERTVLAAIPAKWRGVTFDSSDPNIHRTAMKKGRDYAESLVPGQSKSLFLYSHSYGTGKTHLAACITNYVLRERKLRVRFETARDLMLEIKRTYSERDFSEADVLDRLLGFDLLVLDDVGVDPPTDWLKSTYWLVFNRRLDNQLPMVITTNYSLLNPEKDECLGDRIGFGAVSRLREMCGDNIIKFGGKDMR